MDALKREALSSSQESLKLGYFKANLRGVKASREEEAFMRRILVYSKLKELSSEETLEGVEGLIFILCNPL